MKHTWSILHAGALGDLALTLQLARRLPGVSAASTLMLISRTDSGEMSAFQPAVVRHSSEGLGLHWLYAESNDPPPGRLLELVADRRILNAIGDRDSIVHRQLGRLSPRAIHSFDPRLKLGSKSHITTQWRREIDSHGLLMPKCIYEHRGQVPFVAPDAVRQRGLKLFGESSLGAPPILFHPGSGGREKCWPLRCFLDTARRLRESGADVCFLLGPVERERWGGDVIDSICSEYPLIESPSPDELLALLAATRLLISNDSGPAHLAALIGAPTVTIFGPTSSTVWRPLGPRARVIEGDATAAPNNWGIAPERVAEVALLAIESKS